MAQNGSGKRSKLLKRLRKRLRKRAKSAARSTVARVGRVMARQSLIADQPVADIEQFPWAAEIEAHYDTIRAELERVLERRESLPRLHDLQKQQYRISADDKWKAFVLKGWGLRAEEGERLCPKTLALVEQVPGVRTAFFSVLDAGAQIPEHRGFMKGLLRAHLPMIVPDKREDCTIWLEDTPYHWEERRMFIFDDTYRHKVHNDTDQERIVLLLHFDRPMTRRGRILHQVLMAVIRRSGFVRTARRNYERWASDFRDQGKEGRTAA